MFVNTKASKRSDHHIASAKFVKSFLKYSTTSSAQHPDMSHRQDLHSSSVSSDYPYLLSGSPWEGFAVSRCFDVCPKKLSCPVEVC